MCIGIFADAGVALPGEDTMKICWGKNPHGAGIAYLTEKNQWHVTKGLMSWKHFWKTYQGMNFEDDHTVLIHFRYATTGKKTKDGKPHPGCTHPFPISDKLEDVMQQDYLVDNIAMHNGVLEKNTTEMSDSQKWVMNYIHPLLPYIEDEKVINVLAKVCDAETTGSSRWMFGIKDKIMLVGKWIKEEETGIWYSKNTWKPEPKKTVTSFASYGHIRTTNTTRLFLENYAKDFCDKLGKWNWDLWSDRYKDNKKDINVTEIYDANNEILGIVDDQGNVVWAEDTKPEVEETANQETVCPDCGGCISHVSIYDNLCPWCYGDIESVHENGDACPYCENSKEVNKTFTKDGKQRIDCLVCGCVFEPNKVGYEGVIDWLHDDEIKKIGDACK